MKLFSIIHIIAIMLMLNTAMSDTTSKPAKSQDGLEIAVRAEREVAAAIKLLDAKFKFLRWAGINTEKYDPTIASLKNEYVELQKSIEQKNSDKGLLKSIQSTELLWRAFRETKPELDARPGKDRPVKERFPLVLEMVKGSNKFADIKISNLRERGQTVSHFENLLNESRKLIEKAQNSFNNSQFKEAMQNLSAAVASVDKALVEMPRNSSGY